MKSLGMRTGARLWVYIVLTIFGAQGFVLADEAVSPLPGIQSLPPDQISAGAIFGDQQSEVFGDILVPVYQHQNDLIFVNPRGSWNDDDSQEFNFGIGGRHLFPDKSIIVGGNIFCDRRQTTLGNTFNQVGAGVEFLSQWLDARANCYLPENREKKVDEYVVATGTSQEHAGYWYAPSAQGHVISQYGYEVDDVYNLKTLQHYSISERAMEGFDAEIGSLLPIPGLKEIADVKAFVGYFDYNATYGSDVTGVKGRIEVRPVPAIYLDAGWYEDTQLIGSRYSFGVRASIPFDLSRLSQGKNPFAGALSGFKVGHLKDLFPSRLTEMVIRDLHIRTDVSNPTELVNDRRVLEKTLVSHERKDYTETLARDVTFVDNDNRSGVENGTWENPYRQINVGMRNAIGNLVYVGDAAQPYYENVVMREGITLWGSGAPIYGAHGVFRGSGVPSVNGQGLGPTITLANHVMVTGFELMQPMGTSSSHPVIYGENVSDVTIMNNTIRGNGSASSGIELKSTSMPSFETTISGNSIMGAAGAGVDISLVSVQNVKVSINQNTVTGNSGDGLGISMINGGAVNVFISGNYSGNGAFGVQLFGNPLQDATVELRSVEATGNGVGGINAVLQAFSGDISLALSDVSAKGNMGNGVFADLYGYEGVNVFFGNVVARNNQVDGLHAQMVSGGMVNANFINDKFSENGSDGLFLALDSGLDARIQSRGGEFSNNGANGVNFQTFAPWDSIYDFGMAGGGAADYGLNVLAGNGAYQLLFNGPGTLSASGNWWGTPTPVGAVDYQGSGGGVVIVDPALISMPAP